MNSRNGLRSLVVSLSLAALAGCGSTPATSGPPGYYVTVGTLSFSPTNLTAPSGATITVVNASATDHSVTQQAGVDLFVLGAPAGITPADTGLFHGGTRTFTLPTGLPDGTVLLYYCRNHTSMMAPSTLTITITAAAPPTSGGGVSGY